MLTSVPKPDPAAPATEATRQLRSIRGIPIRVILPNLVTILALCLGLFAMRFSFEGQYEYAVLAIAAAAVLDGLDGRLARAIRGTSRFGAELDSLADFVDFGVAPAFLLYVWILHDIKGAGWFAATAFAIACALRLARFNVMIENPDKPAWASNFFTGMPAPAGAMVGLLPAYLHLLGLPLARAYVPFEIAYVVLVAFLMASRIPHFSGKNLGRVPREHVIAVLFGVAVALLLLVTFPMEMLAAAAVLYLALIPFSVKRYRELDALDKAGTPQQA